MVRLLFLLLVGHCLCDYPLQGNFLSQAKRPGAIPGVPWGWALTSHAAIQSGMVYYFTNSPELTAVEFVLHWAIDFSKCRGLINFSVDQCLHVACKVVYVAALALV